MLKLYLTFVYVMVSTSSVLANRPKNNTNPTTDNPFSDLLSKFHQNDYKLTFERSEIARSDPNFIDLQLRTFKYNRTTPVVNASFILTVDMGYDVQAICQFHRFASNEYRIFPMRFQVNACEVIASGAMGADKVSKCGNVICPLQKGKKYYYCNWAPEEARFPPLIPSGQYMLQIQFTYRSQEFAVTNSYGVVHRPIPYV